MRPGNLQETQVVSVHSGCCNRILCTGAYTTETYVSLFWPVWFLVRAVLLLYRWLPSSCVLTWPLVCVCVCVCGEREKGREGGREWGGGRLFGVSSNEDTIPMKGPHLYDLIQCYFFGGSVSKYSHTRGWDFNI